MIDEWEGKYHFLSHKYPALVQDRDGGWHKSVYLAHPVTHQEWMAVLRQKFHYPELGAKLLATGDQYIAGEACFEIMEVRDELRVAARNRRESSG